MSSSSHRCASASEDSAFKGQASISQWKVPEGHEFTPMERNCTEGSSAQESNIFPQGYTTNITKQQFMQDIAERVAKCRAEAEQIWQPVNRSAGKPFAPLAGCITGIKDSNHHSKSSAALQSLRRHAVNIRAVIPDINDVCAAMSYRQEYNHLYPQ